MNNKSAFTCWMLILAFVLSACGPSTPKPPLVVMAYPPGLPYYNKLGIWGSPTVAPPGTPRTLNLAVYVYPYDQQQPGHNTGISQGKVFYGGQQIGSVNFDPDQPYSQATLQWTPPSTPGEYTVTLSSGDLLSVNAKLCVENLGVTIDYLQAFMGDPCAPPPAPTLTGPFSIDSATAFVDQLDCKDAAIEFDVHVTDPSNQISYVYIELNNAGGPGGEHTVGLAGSPGQSDYGFYVDWWTPGLADQFSDTDITIKWTAHAVRYTGQLLSDGPHEIQLMLPTCAGNLGNAPLVMKPFLPHIVATPTTVLEAGRKKPKGTCPAGQTYSCTGGLMTTCGCK